MAYRGRTSRRTSSPRRKLVWARTSNQSTFTQGAPFTPFQADLLADFNTRYGADALGITVARIRGIMAMETSVAAVTLPGVMAIRVGAEGEVASTEFNPHVNGKYLDWMAYEPFFARPNTTDFGSGAQASTRVIDVKANRKVSELDETLFLYAGSNTATAGTMSVFYNLSILLMLP